MFQMVLNTPLRVETNDYYKTIPELAGDKAEQSLIGVKNKFLQLLHVKYTFRLAFLWLILGFIQAFYQAPREIKPCVPNALFLYPLKTSENLRLSYVYRG